MRRVLQTAREWECLGKVWIKYYDVQSAVIGRCDPRRNLTDDTATGIFESVDADSKDISGYEV